MHVSYFPTLVVFQKQPQTTKATSLSRKKEIKKNKHWIEKNFNEGE